MQSSQQCFISIEAVAKLHPLQRTLRGSRLPATLEKIANQSIVVGVIGLGYVGLPLSFALAEAGVEVIGFDVDSSKIESINAGKSYIQHINHGRLEQVIASGKFSATTEYERSSACDVLVICVPTPLNHHLEPDLSYVVATCEALAPHLNVGTLVSLESTTWPGTTREVVVPALDAGSGLTAGVDYYVCFSPEREDPGNCDYGTSTIPKLVGASDAASLELAAAFYRLCIDEVVPIASTEVAETAKLFENIFRSVNIALVNELKVICDSMGINVWAVIEAAATKPFGFMPFWPGPGLGGHCIPIDPFYLSWKAKAFGITTRFIELAGEINRSMPHYVVGKVQDCLNDYGKPLKGARILILGLSYKADIDDMRESPSLELIRLLEGKGGYVDYHDPNIPVIGMTREYSDLAGRKSAVISGHYDCFLLATAHSCFDSNAILAAGVPVVDTRNVLPRQQGVYPA